MSKYPIVNLGELVDYDFYHLDHYHPWGSRSSATHRRVNTGVQRRFWAFIQTVTTGDWLPHRFRSLSRTSSSNRPFGGTWHVLSSISRFFSCSPCIRRCAWRWIASSIPSILCGDAAPGSPGRLFAGSPLIRWPGLLRRIWVERPSAQARSLGRAESHMATERTVSIAERLVGHERPCFIVAEIGINHNGDLESGEAADRTARATRGATP